MVMDECDDFGDRDRAYYIVTKVTIVGRFFLFEVSLFFFFLGGGGEFMKRYPLMIQKNDMPGSLV